MKFDQYLELNKNSQADFHTHTTYCDGGNTAEEMAAAAFAQGLKVYGFSGHGYTSYDESYCMLPAEEAAYEAEVRALVEKYTGSRSEEAEAAEAAEAGDCGKASGSNTGQMKILCGVEQDCLAGEPTRDWDYVIGSVHYIDCRDCIDCSDSIDSTGCSDSIDSTGCSDSNSCSDDSRGTVTAGELAEDDWAAAYPTGIVPIDESREIWLDIVDRFFGGDMYAMIERYYETASQVVARTGADIIGHFDLITKYNTGGEGGRQGALFDESHPRYIAAWQKAVDILLQTGTPFEINTGGMTRGYRTDAYPAKPIRDYIAARGGRFILSSDSHSTESLCSSFDRYQSYL